MSPSLFATAIANARTDASRYEHDPRWRLRCDICGRFADRTTSHVTYGYFDNTPDSCDWNPGECWCKKCKGPA